MKQSLIDELSRLIDLKFENKENKDNILLVDRGNIDPIVRGCLVSQIFQKLLNINVLVLLDEKGLEFTSVKGAQWLEKISHHCAGKIVFAAGGAYGFTEAEYARADYKLSLSKMTFTHEMVRVFFLEQLYRLLSIQRGEPYHHE